MINSNQDTGILPSLNIRIPGIESNEINIIKSLSKVFLVTFIKSTVFKNTKYVYTFVRPTKDLKEKYRLQNEILILLNNNENFDGRFFDYVDKLLFEYQNRLDKLCVIFIGRDQRLKEKVKRHIQNNPESRIIIPFSYLDFFRGDARNTILHRLQEFFYGRDLFAFESPLQNDTYFYGRNEVVQFFYDKFKAGENSGLFGLRKIGKTSVLFALQRYLVFRNEVPLFIDCQEPSFHKRRWYQSLNYIIKMLSQYVTNELKISTAVEIAEYNELDASERFQEHLLYFNALLEGKRILFILDEIESITFGISPSEHWRQGDDFIYFWQSIRAIFQKQPHLFSFIVAGVNPRAIETAMVNEFDNPIYRMVTATYLKFFGADSVKDMVSNIGNYMGMSFDEEIYTYLTEDYGGHPFLIRQVCSKMHQQLSKNRPVQVSKYLYKENKETYDLYLKDYIELMITVLEKWYPKEYELIQLLAIDDLETFKSKVSDSEKIIEHLIGYNLVDKHGEEYHIRIEAIKLYLLEKSKLIKVSLPLVEKWKIVTEKRNTFELDLRKVVKLVIKSKHGPVKGKEKFLEIIEEKRRERLKELGFDEMLKDGEIYFLDLRNYILKSWELFDQIFIDKNLFDYSTQLVNKYRIDAHAKEITHEELVQLVNTINELHRKISNFMS